MLPTLKTNRLILRPFMGQDALRVQELAGDYEIAKTTLNVPHPYEDGMAEQWISTHEKSCVDNNLYTLAIVMKETNALMGCISLSLNKGKHKGEVGYWLGLPYWGKGYCTEAVNAVIAFAFDTLNINKVIGRYFTSNPASGKVMEKAGMAYEGTMREDVIKDGRFYDIGFRSILRKEYLDRK